MTVLATKAVYRAAEAERFLRLLVEPGQVFEIRALKAFLRGQRRRGTVAGYFNCPAVAAKAIAAIESAAAIYVTLNAVDAAVHARAFNRLKLLEDRDPTTSDANIVRRRWLLVDVDFARPANVSATDAEHQAAIDRAAEIRAALAALGWPEPLYLSSGNGAHLLYRVDLDSNDDGLVDRVLQALNTLYGDDELKVDCSVGNPARITKLVGTLVCKGDDTPDRPHRVSEFIEVPDVLRVVPVEDLNAIVEKAEVFAPADEEDAAGGDHEESHASNNREFDLEAWIDKHCPGAKGPKKTHDGEVWTMPCPWNKEHTGGCAHIIRRKNGKLGAACKHNTCKGKGWQALRDLKEPNRPRPGAFVSNVSSSRKDSQKIEWSQPRALPDELPPVEPFDLDLLPAEFRPWIADISERMQCPPDFPAVASMVVAAGLLGRRIGIRPKRFDNWLVVANLWAMVIGRPGIMKTPAITEPVNVLKRLEIEAKNEYAAEMREFKAAQMVAKVRQKACETEIKNDLKHGGDGMAIATSVIDAESDEPARRRYLVNDTSVEKLGEILGDNPNGVTVFRDELVGLLKSLEKEGQESARAFYLEAWNGTGRHTFDRIVRGTIDIEAAIVSILGGIQPSRLSEYLRAAVHGGTGDDMAIASNHPTVLQAA